MMSDSVSTFEEALFQLPGAEHFKWILKPHYKMLQLLQLLRNRQTEMFPKDTGNTSPCDLCQNYSSGGFIFIRPLTPAEYKSNLDQSGKCHL